MASITINITDAKYAEKKPTIIQVCNYAVNKLEGETENQFVERKVKQSVNLWYKGLEEQKQLIERDISEDIFT